MLLILDCTEGLNEFINIVNEESFPICDIDAFLSIVVDIVFNNGETADSEIHSLIYGDRLFSRDELTPEEKERIRYGVATFIALLEKKVEELKISFNRESRFDYKEKHNGGCICLEHSFVT